MATVSAETNSDPNTTRDRSLLETARDVAFICAIYLFFAGFLYQYFWYNALGIPFHPSDVGIDQTLVFAYYAFADNLGSVAIASAVAVIIVLATLVFAPRLHWKGSTRQAVGRGLVLLGAIVMFPLLYGWSRVATFEALAHPISGHPESLVLFTIRSSAKSNYDQYFYKYNGKTLTLVAESDKFFYALAIPTADIDPCAKIVPPTFVFAVDKDDVASMRTFIPGRQKGGAKNGDSNAGTNC